MSEIGVGLVGYKFMGRAHSNGYRQVAHFFDVDPAPKMVAICGRDEAGVKAAAGQLGWDGYETDYRKLIARDDIGLVDVSTIGNTHHEIVLEALAAGKHVLCEKPLANTLGEAKEMLDAATAAEAKGIVSMINFNYRRVPAVEFARKLVADGKIGEVRHWRAVYLQDWINDPNFPLVWRLQKDLAGTGALGDIAAHIVDLAHYVVGPITGVVGALDTFIKERPLETASSGGAGLTATAANETGKVTVDDSASFLAKFENGASGTFSVTRLAPGRRNYNSFEINGSEGSISFNLERLNELGGLFHRRSRRAAGLPHRSRSPTASPVRRRLVASGSHHRLRAQLRPPDQGIARRHQGRQIPGPDIQGRLQLPGRPRRSRAVLFIWHLGDAGYGIVVRVRPRRFAMQPACRPGSRPKEAVAPGAITAKTNLNTADSGRSPAAPDPTPRRSASRAGSRYPAQQWRG